MSSQIWFTSDTHFGHAAMADRPDGTRKGWRPFTNIASHDAHLIKAWNRVVQPGDQVWHLGDVGLSNDHYILECVGRLHGEKHLVTGNHDAVWPGHRKAYTHQRRWLEVFSSVQQYARRRVAGVGDVMLSHFPYSGDHHGGEDRETQYRLPDEGRWLLHGHVHDAWARSGRQINVGVDVRDWTPMNLFDAIAEMKAAREE